MYYCHNCGAPLDYSGICSDCGIHPIYDWMTDNELKKEDEYKKDNNKED